MKNRVVTLIIILCILIGAHSDIKGSSIDYESKQVIGAVIQNKSDNNDDKRIKVSSSVGKEVPEEVLKEVPEVVVKEVPKEKDLEDKDSVLAVNTKKSEYMFPSEDPVRAKPGKDKFLVKVAISEQKVYVYKNDIEIRTMDCSTGLEGTDSDTPIDNYKINSYYGQSFYSSKYEQGARYWVGFIGSQYLFHSVPTGEDGEIIATEADMIGKRASHGCIRLSVDDAFWFYETIPEGADVITTKIL